MRTTNGAVRDDGGSAGTTAGRTVGRNVLAGAALLDRLRCTGRARPAADPAFVDELRSFLEDGVDVGAPGLHRREAPVVVTGDRLERALTCAVHRAAGGAPTGGGPTDAGRTFSLPLACGALVAALFRQVVTTGTLGDPMTDGLEALALGDRGDGLVEWIRRLPADERAELRAEVDRQGRDLASRWPRLDPSWLPRTHEVACVPLAAGAVELRARIDLAVGRPAAAGATVVLVDVRSGARRPGHRDARGFDALVEALRSLAPPFAVATYYTRTGELDVDAVDHELLVAAARRCRAGLQVLTGAGADPVDGVACAACRGLLRRPPVVVPVAAVPADPGDGAMGAGVPGAGVSGDGAAGDGAAGHGPDRSVAAFRQEEAA